MKLKLLLALVVLALVATSCNKDEIEDLDKRLDKVENAIGSDQPITIKYATKDYANADVIKNISFYFKAADWETSYFYDYGDGTYDIYIERFSDVEWYNGASIDFYYDSNTGETEVYNLSAYFEHEMGYQNPNFYYWAANNTRTVNVKSFDPSTGKINLTATANSTDAYSYNEYEGKAMSMNLSFKGTVSSIPAD